MTTIRSTPAVTAFRTCLSIVAASVMASACYTTTVRSGKPPAPAAIQYDGKWHHGMVYGLAELSGPYNLQEVCPNGWAEITTETSFVNGIAQTFTSSIYSPQSVTVRCAKDTASSAAAESPETSTELADTPEPASADAEETELDE